MNSLQLDIAARILAGLASNPEIYRHAPMRSPDRDAALVRYASDMARRLIESCEDPDKTDRLREGA